MISAQAVAQVTVLRRELDNQKGAPYLHVLQLPALFDQLPIHVLHQLHMQLKSDLDVLEKICAKAGITTVVSSSGSNPFYQ